MEVEFKLDAFQGPLDLLLHLISKHKLNICDIEISLLLDQYLEYMNQLDEQDYESAGEFLEMAARLIYIKTVSLLPQPEEAEELKKDLEGQIIEYSICKLAAQKLKELYVGNDIFVRDPIGVIVDKTYTRIHEAHVLYDAFMGISAKSRNSKPLRADMFSPIVSHKIVSVTSKIIFVLKKLYKTGVYEMSGLYDGVTDKSEKVATFLAILELTKSGRIYINEDNSEIRFIKKSKSEKRSKDENIDNHKESRVEDAVNNDESVENYNVSDDESVNSDEELTPEVKVSTERIYVPQIVANNVVSDLESEDFSVECEQTWAEEYTEEHSEETIDETFENLVDDSLESEQAELSEEVLELIQLSEFVDPPVNIFKPNYWNKRKYYWGNTPLGQNGKNNYWYYG